MFHVRPGKFLPCRRRTSRLLVPVPQAIAIAPLFIFSELGFRPPFCISTGMITSNFFASVYEKGFRSTLRLLIAKGVGVDEAEEFAQSAWARGWEAREQLKDPSRLIAWVNSIALNKLFNERRRGRRFEELDNGQALRAPASTIHEKIDADRMLSQCSALDRNLLLDRYEGGMEMEEIAARHGMTSVAARVRMHRSRLALRSWAGAEEVVLQAAA